MKGAAKFLLLYVIVCIFYVLWMTAGTFVFSECEVWPNYNSLARAFASGQLFLDDHGLEDFVWHNGRAYMYQGPMPAVFRLPVVVLLDKGIPTGLMVALFCAGVVLLFALTLDQLTGTEPDFFHSPLKMLYTVTLACSGFTLVMVTVPSFHHEAIASAMFFLMGSIYLSLRAKNNGYQLTVAGAILLGCSMAFCLASRTSYAPSLAIVGVWLALGWWRAHKGDPLLRAFTPLGIAGGIATLSLICLLFYNKARFGAFFDFGMKYQASIAYQEYFLQGNYFRYDHLPYNLWHMFFRLPAVIAEFPFLQLPAYLLKVQSAALMPYQLINSNELAVSIFSLMPITVLFVFPTIQLLRATPYTYKSTSLVLLGVLAIQVTLVALTVASIARYYFDFLPIFMLLSFLGALWVNEHYPRSRSAVLVLAALSVVVSFALPMNALTFYAEYIPYRSPLFSVFFGL